MRPLVVINGGQAFVQRPTPGRVAKDERRIARILPPGRRFVLPAYPAVQTADLDELVAVYANVIRELGAPAQVVGISYGGLVALRLAADHPALVSDLVLLVSARRFSAEGERRVQRQIDCARRGDLVALVEDFAAVFRRPWLNALLRLRLRLQRGQLPARMNDPEAIIAGLERIRQVDLGAERLRAITARCLLIGGSRDPFFGEGVVEETAAMLPDATVRMFEGETHMVPVERSRDVARAIAAFLAA